MRHVALYCRISEDRTEGAGVRAQEEQGREYAASAWPGMAIEVYCDNNISASTGQYRKHYERLRQAIRDGHVAHLWTVEQSRLDRREVGWFELAAELTEAGIEVVHTNRDGIVRVGDEVAAIKAVLAAAESRKIKARIRPALDKRAQWGVPSGGKTFGYEHVARKGEPKTLAVVPAQAEAITWAAEKILAGWSQTDVADQLARRGLTGARGGKITSGQVRDILTNGTVAGRRIYRGVDVGPGNWEAIIDPETWQLLRSKLGGPRRVTRSDGRSYPVRPGPRYTGRVYILTGGLALCGRCEAPLIGSTIRKQTSSSGTRVRKYLLCNSRVKGVQVGRGCIGIMADETEQYVADCVFDALDRPEFLAAMTVDEHAFEREQLAKSLGALDAQRQELAGMWGERRLTMEEWRAAKNGIDATELGLRAQLAAVPVPPARVNIEDARSSWPLMTLDEKRELVRLFVESVIIFRATPGRRGFDPERVAIVWR